MINSVRVYDFTQAKEIINGNKQTNYNAWITTTDDIDSPEVEALKRRNLCRKIPHLALYFEDISENKNTHYIPVKNGPKQEHVDQLFSFLKKLHDSSDIYNLGINCYAGISRSTATALLAFTIKGETPVEAMESLLRIRPQSFPNLKILKLASKYIGKELYEYVKKWETNSEVLYVPVRAWN